MTDGIAWLGRGTLPLRAGLGAAMLSLLVSLVLVQLLAGEHGSPIAPPSVAAHEGLWSLPAAAQGPISAAIGSDGRSYRVSAAAGGGFEALSAAQRVRSRFGPSGV